MTCRDQLGRRLTCPGGSARPGYPPGFSPKIVHTSPVRKPPKIQQGADSAFSRRVGTGELRGKLKDELRAAIHATRNPGLTRERIADALGTTAGEVAKKTAPEDPRHLAAHELPAVAAVLGDEVLHQVCAAAGGIFIRLDPIEDDPDDSLCDLLLTAQDAAGDLAAAIRDVRRAVSDGAEIDNQSAQRIEAAGLATLRSYQILMLAVCGRTEDR